MSAHRRDGGGVGDLQPARQDLGVVEVLEAHGVGVRARVVVVDPVDALGHEHDLRADLQRPLRGAGVGGEERHPEPGAEDDDAALLEVADRPARDVGLGDLAHRDRGLHAGVDALPSPGSPAGPGSS